MSGFFGLPRPRSYRVRKSIPRVRSAPYPFFPVLLRLNRIVCYSATCTRVDVSRIFVEIEYRSRWIHDNYVYFYLLLLLRTQSSKASDDCWSCVGGTLGRGRPLSPVVVPCLTNETRSMPSKLGLSMCYSTLLVAG